MFNSTRTATELQVDKFRIVISSFYKSDILLKIYDMYVKWNWYFSLKFPDIGRIEEMIEEEGGTAKVTWPSGEITTVNTGKDGLVEIKLVEPHHVGHVYIDHIPAAGNQ